MTNKQHIMFDEIWEGDSFFEFWISFLFRSNTPHMLASRANCTAIV